MTTATTFLSGQKVRSNTNAQGLTKGLVYLITDVHTEQTSFGLIVVYTVSPVTDDLVRLSIRNGHLLFARA